MQFDLSVLQASFDAPTLTRGRDYFERRRVLRMELGSETIDAQVIGTQRLPYSVQVKFIGANGSTRLLARCSCPVATNCKHGAAVAFAAIASRPSGRKRDAADGAVESWIESVTAAHSGVRRDLSREHVRYAIGVEERFFVPFFTLAAFLVPVLRSGELGTARRYELQHLGSGSAKQLLQLDRTIGRLVAASGLLGGMNALSPTILGTLLELLLQSGRLHWRTLNSPVLESEPVREATIAWRVDDDGRQRAHLAGRPSSVLVGASPLWYVDPDRCVAGPVKTDIAADLAALFATAPALTPEHAKRVQVALRRVFTSAGIEGPHASLDRRVIDRDPTPRLQLRLGEDRRSATAEIVFLYGEHAIAPQREEREFQVPDGDREATWPRQRGFEERSVERLLQLGFLPLVWPAKNPEERERALYRLGASEEEYAWVRFLGGSVPALRADGWRVDIDESFPYEIVEFGDEWHAELLASEERSGWFEFDLGIEVD
ncbi:MAG TPA: hypothetical protein VMV73_03395, partial [Candidatus Dormibacteraeota bacterium]|nr:hypothetical protein [Candidatus Dormibacteraeota bacterium]